MTTVGAVEKDEAAPVSGGLAHEVKATAMVLRRELIRFRYDRARMFAMLVQPLLFLFVMGTGLSSVVTTTGDLDFRTFLFSGVLAMSVLFSAAFAGVSLVWDREFGFLREMLVAPVSKTAIILGKVLGGATTATLQTLVLLAFAWVVDVPYDPLLLLTLLGLLFISALMLTSLGIVLSARLTQIQSAMPITQLIIAPMMFLSGALFPMANLPDWLAILTKINPLTYVVQPMRSAVFSHLELSAATRAAFDPAITWGGWTVPVGVSVLIALACTAVLMAAGIALFKRTD